MKLADFEYELPPERIAQSPAQPRDASRLFVLRRGAAAGGKGAADAQGGGRDVPFEHAVFRDIGRFLTPGDLLVLNDTRVLPARLRGAKGSGGRIEILLVEPEARGDGTGDVWLCIAGFSRPPREGASLDFGGGLDVRYLGPGPQGMHRVTLRAPEGTSLREALALIGEMPLPPYIRRNGDPSAALADAERYQTVYAAREGAIAAPTAGLHYTKQLLADLRGKGIGIAKVTLHVGPATFLPVRTEEVQDHPMGAERYEIPRATAQAVAAARRRGGRVVAVGTTVVRALESASDGRGGILPAAGRTDLYVYPGYRFRVVDALVTNFHLPRSTLLVLVAAFAGRERILEAYREAVAAGYRFYSYGDAMLIL